MSEKLGITAIVGQFVGNITTDSRGHRRFAKTDSRKLARSLVQQAYKATGGQCQFTARDMATTQRPRFSAARNSTGPASTLRRHSTNSAPNKERKELLAAIGFMQGDIVDK